MRFGDDADALTRFFGEFNFVLGGVGFLLQVLLTGRALRLFGVVAVILVLPIALAIGSAVTVLAPVFLVVLLVNAADQSLRFTVDKTAYALLYLPLPPGERPAIKHALDILASGVLLGLATGGFLLWPGAGLDLRGTRSHHVRGSPVLDCRGLAAAPCVCRHDWRQHPPLSQRRRAADRLGRAGRSQGGRRVAVEQRRSGRQGGARVVDEAEGAVPVPGTSRAAQSLGARHQA